MKRIATILISTLCLATAMAQDETLEEPLVEEEARRYTVEVIVFSYEENVSVGSEVFLADEVPVEEEPLGISEDDLLVETEEPVELFTDPGDELDVEEPPRWTIYTGEEIDTDTESTISELQLVLLGEEELTLNDASRQFELLDAYSTILHFGWTQPVFPEEETPAITLRLLAEPPEGLDGTFTLYLSRYLHLVVDLALDAPSETEETAATDEPLFSFGDSRSRYDDDIDLAPQPIRYRIQEHRIVKNGELRYFDHPKFGVLAKITRVEEEEEDESGSGTDAEPLVGGTSE